MVRQIFFKPLLLILFASFVIVVKGQLLTTSPFFPTDTSSVTVTVNCAKGNQGLYNYAVPTDVYVHVGVITNLSSSTTDWRYVKFTWGTAAPAAQTSYLGNNMYAYTINGIRSFFGVPAGETIKKIAILFRNGNGSVVERNSDGSDMFVSVYDSSLATQFLLPAFQPLYSPIPEPIQKNIGDSLAVEYISNHAAGLKLYFNGSPVDSENAATSIQTSLPITTGGNQHIVALANDGINSSYDSFSFYVAVPTNIAPLPPGAVEGINYLPGDTSVILVLFAPYKNKIVVTGDFSNWTQQPEYQMNRTPDSNYYWIQINGLTPGNEYAYQYVIDDTLIVADYNTEKVLDKNVDPSIPSSTYPGLKSFPSQASGTLAGIIQTAKPQYNWQANNFQRPDKSSLVIYELLVRDFIAAGNWQILADTLSYLKTLGVNAIEIMPFTNFEGASSWGYNPNFYFAPDKVYGTETALKQFIDVCHQQGIAVIMDMVLNHSFGSSPMVQMYWDNRNNIPAANSPWFNQYPTHAFNVGYQFNHESRATKTFTKRVISYWLHNYHIDGYRFDLAKGFTQKRTCDAMGNNCNVTAWGEYDSSRVVIWDTIYNQLQAISPNSYCILEMFADNSEETAEANYGMMLWGNMNDNYNQATMGYSTPSPTGGTWDLSWGIYTARGWNEPNLITYQESHDEERLMYKNEQYGNNSGTYNIKNIPTGLLRNELATAFWALIPGPKMLWEFGELGYDYSINTCTNGTVDPSGNCRTTAKPIRWDYLQDQHRKHLHDVYMGLFKLRADYPSLNTSNNISYSLQSAFKTFQVADSTLGITVIGNFDVIPASGTVNFQNTGTWYNYFTGDSLVVNNTSQNFTLNPGEYRVYLNKKIRDTLSAPADTTQVQISDLSMKIFPNPVSGGGSVVEYFLPEDGNTSIAVFNFMGQRLCTFNQGEQTKGGYTYPMSQLPFNVSLLANGLYIMEIRSNQKKTHTVFMVHRQ